MCITGKDEKHGEEELTESDTLRRAEAVRHFNRFYTRHIGALHEHLQKSAFSLTEVRVLNELSRGRANTAAALARNLGLDTGYLSRILTSFERRNLLTRRPSEFDARQSLLSLTEQGRAEYEPLEKAAVAEVRAVLTRLPQASQQQLIGAMKLIERLLDDRPQRGLVKLRAPTTGEASWLVHRQAQLMAAAHGWDARFEALLARTVAGFAESHDAQREACWIAEQDGMTVGSALVAARSQDTARVRMFYMEPDMQRLGIGAQLLEECVRFAKNASYGVLSLSLATVMEDARRLAARMGFHCAGSKEAHRFGHPLTIERWELTLS